MSAPSFGGDWDPALQQQPSTGSVRRIKSARPRSGRRTQAGHHNHGSRNAAALREQEVTTPQEAVKLLLVGDPDHTSAIKNAKLGLAELGYECVTALHHEDALKVLAAENPKKPVPPAEEGGGSGSSDSLLSVLTAGSGGTQKKKDHTTSRKRIGAIVASVAQVPGHIGGSVLAEALLRAAPNLPLFMLFNQSSNSEASELCLDAGATAVLVPPFSGAALQRTLTPTLEANFWQDVAVEHVTLLRAQKHEHKLKLAGERERLSGALLSAREAAASTKSRLKAKLASREAEIEAATERRRKLEASERSLLDSVKRLERDGAEGRSKLQQLDATADQTSSAIAALKARVSELEEELRGSREAAAALQEKLEEIHAREAATLESKTQSLRTRLAKRDRKLKRLTDDHIALRRLYNALLLGPVTSEAPQPARMNAIADPPRSDTKEALEESFRSPLQQMTNIITELGTAESKGPLSPKLVNQTINKLASILRSAADKDLNSPCVKHLAEAVAPGDAETAKYLKTELYTPELEQSKKLDVAAESDDAGAESSPRREKLKRSDSVRSESSENSEDSASSTASNSSTSGKPRRASAREKRLSSTSQAKFSRSMEFDSLLHVDNLPALEKAACMLFEDPDLPMRKCLRVPATVVQAWVSTVAANYLDNPYHNFAHAVDVASTTAAFLKHTRAAKWLSMLDKIALVVAALVHDVGHPGLNNAYHAAAQTDLARIYNDISVLENYHTAMAFETLKPRPDGSFAVPLSRPLGELVDTDIFSQLAPDQIKAVRKTIVNSIQHTDMAKHFELVSKLEAHLATCGNTSNGELFDAASPDHRLLLCACLLHASDISNPAKPPAIARAWSDRVLTEFLAQGDREKAENRTVSPFCDRENVDQARLNLNFVDFIVAPLFRTLASAMPEFSVSLKHLDKTREVWTSLLPGYKAADKDAAVREAAIKRNHVRFDNSNKLQSFERLPVHQFDFNLAAVTSHTELPALSSSGDQLSGALRTLRRNSMSSQEGSTGGSIGEVKPRLKRKNGRLGGRRSVSIGAESSAIGDGAKERVTQQKLSRVIGTRSYGDLRGALLGRGSRADFP